LDLLSYKTKTETQLGWVKQRIALTQIVAGSLFIREQKKFMISLTQKPLASHVSLFNICPHLEFISVEGFKGYWIPQTTTATCDEPEDCEGGKGISQCEYCFTEFQIDFKHVEGRGDAMFVTRRLDLWRRSVASRFEMAESCRMADSWHTRLATNFL
jgi:hypothetical protein